MPLRIMLLKRLYPERPNDRDSFFILPNESTMSEQGHANNALAPEDLLEKILSTTGLSLPPYLAVRSNSQWPSDLTAHQVDILNRASRTPDLFVIDGVTGTGKTRLALELTQHEIAQGRRVLIVSPTPDAILAQLPNALRGVARGEHLSPNVESRTWNGLLKQAKASLLSNAQTQLETVRQKNHTVLQQLEKLQRLNSLNNEIAGIESILRELNEQQSQLDSTIQTRLSNLLAEKYPDLQQQIVSEQNTITTARQKVSEGANQLASTLSEVTACRAKAAPRKAGWLFFWKTKTDPEAESRLCELERKLTEAEQANQQASNDLKEAEKRLALLQSDLESKRASLLAEEQSNTGQQLQNQIQTLESSMQQKRDELSTLKHSIPEGVFEGELRKQSSDLAAELTLAEDEFTKAQNTASTLTRDKLPAPQVIVAPPVAVLTDPAITSQHFDWLIIDDAHRIGHGQAMACGRKASRHFILGDSHATGANEFFTPLAQKLHRKVWITEGYRRICRRIELAPSDRPKLECEPLADTPEVELRLHTPPDGDPAVAEIAFPASWPEARCRELLARELGEVTATPQGVGDWSETEAEIALSFNTVETTTISILHNDNVLERVVPGSLTFIFPKESEWTREKVEAWIVANLYRGNSGRFAHLTQAQRACPGLARWLNKNLGMHYLVDSTPDEEPHVELLAVPDTSRQGRDERSRRAMGAGFEMDLADTRSRDHRPNIPNLPQTGFINVKEAESIVRLLETLTQSVVVTALSSAQVIVLNHMVQQGNFGDRVRVLTPEEVLQTEPHTLVISLVRSHSNRAVSFNEPPQTLKAMMLRPRHRLIFVGDVGGLERRVQWRRTVDPSQPPQEAELEHQLAGVILNSPRLTLEGNEKKMAMATG